MSIDTRPMPRADEAEVALLCAVMSNPAVAPDVVHLVEPSDFHDPHRGGLWSVVVGVTNAGSAPDAVLVRSEIARLGIKDAGELADLAKSYAASAFVGSNAAAYAHVVREKSLLRRVLSSTAAIHEAVMDGNALDEVMAEARERILAVEDERATPVATMQDVLAEALAEIDGTTATDSIGTGLLSLDDFAGPIEAGQYVLVGARPSMGKTALALNVAYAVAATYGPVLFLSLEMPRRKLARRLICSVAGVDLNSLKPGRFLTDEARGRVTEAGRHLARLPILIDDASSPTIDAVRARVKRHVERDRVRLVILDYIGLIREPSGRTINNRENVVGAISRGLKATAKDYCVPLIALSQLNRTTDHANRDPKNAEDTRPPTLADLRDSGSLEQDADAVWFIHRPGYYTKRPSDQGLAEIHVAKNRDGQTGKVVLEWNGAAQRFSDPAHVA